MGLTRCSVCGCQVGNTVHGLVFGRMLLDWSYTYLTEMVGTPCQNGCRYLMVELVSLYFSGKLLATTFRSSVMVRP